MAKSETNQLAKECIVTALIELMKVKDYHSLTITDITRKAGVSRMAYYRNYSSKEDILNKYMDEVGFSIHDKIEKEHDHEEYYTYFYTLFEQLGKYRDVGVAAYHAHMGELILDNVTKNVLRSFPPKDDSAAERYRRYYLAGAFYTVFMEWLKGGRKESCEEMATICSSIALRGNGNLLDGIRKK